MLPIVSLVGRPNVGKSTLFNKLTKTNDALVVDLPGTTRDRIYGKGRVGTKDFIIIDTGGIGVEEDAIDNKMSAQSKAAIFESDYILFVVDAKVGVTPADIDIANNLRKVNKKIFIVINKIDGLDPELAASEFFSLGFENVNIIAASHSRGIVKLVENFTRDFPEQTDLLPDDKDAIKVAVVGQPNVGKSTFINKMLGEDRLVVFDSPGTTRDSVSLEFEKKDQKYILIDTAGLRKKSKVSETVEKFSAIKTLQSIDYSNVVIFIIDAKRGLLEQDLSLLDYVVNSGKALVVCINKSDAINSEEQKELKKILKRKLHFVSFAKQHFISAHTGYGLSAVFKSVEYAFKSAMRDLNTNDLTKILSEIVKKHEPALVRGKRSKLKYAHAGGKNPPLIIIHGNKTDCLSNSYKKYLYNSFLEELTLQGTPIRLEFKSSDNPYKDRVNTLTPRQIRKKKRLKEYISKTKKN